MGCGLEGNRVEGTLAELMARSKSKLTLSLQPNKPTSTALDDFVHYNLLQTMETGETLVWQNEPLPVREYLSSGLSSDTDASTFNEEMPIAEKDPINSD